MSLRTFAPLFALSIAACSSTPANPDGGGADAAPADGGGTDGAAADAAPDAPALSTKAALEIVATRKVYFAHNSVGGNILDGLESIATQQGVTIHRQWFSNAQTFAAPVFAESGVDTNGDPMQKISDFEGTRMPAVGAGPRYAFFKMCFVDFDSGSDAQAIAQAYIASAKRLAQKYPQTTFVHFTVPLCTAADTASNDKRNDYSDLIRAAFPASAVFDLATAESTRGDGTKETYTSNGKTRPALAPDWASNDDCHLSSAGGEAMATALVKYLAALP